MPIVNVPPRRLSRLLQLIRERRQQLNDANKITTEVVEAAHDDGTYTVAGAVLTTTGDARLRAGQEVAVASKEGTPRAIIEHFTRRARFAPVVAPSANPLIEELFFATDPATGETDLYIRNYSQVTPLSIGAQMGFGFALSFSTVGLAFNVAEDDALFTVPKRSTASQFSVPKELPVFKLNRRRSHPAPPSQRLTASLLKTVDLSWVQGFYTADLVTLDKGLATSVTVNVTAGGGLQGLSRTWIDAQARVFILVAATYTFNFGLTIGLQSRRLTVFNAETHAIVWDSVLHGTPFISPQHYLFPTATDGTFRSTLGDLLDVTDAGAKIGLRIDVTDFLASSGAVTARGVFLYYPTVGASLADQIGGLVGIGRNVALKALGTDTDTIFSVTTRLYNRHRYLWGKGSTFPVFTGLVKMTLLDEADSFRTTTIGTAAANWIPLGLFLDGHDFLLRTGFNFDTGDVDDTIKPEFLRIDQLNESAPGFPQKDVRLKLFQVVKDLPSDVLRVDADVIYRVINDQDILRPLGRFVPT